MIFVVEFFSDSGDLSEFELREAQTAPSFGGSGITRVARRPAIDRRRAAAVPSSPFIKARSSSRVRSGADNLSIGMLPAGQRRQPKARLPVAIKAACIPTNFPAILSLHPVIVPLGCNESEVMSSIPLTSRNSGASLLWTRIRFVNVWSRAVSATASLYAGRAARSVGGPIDAQFASAAMSKRRPTDSARWRFSRTCGPPPVFSPRERPRAPLDLKTRQAAVPNSRSLCSLSTASGFLRPHL
jgi:hypothetical protein